jgi:type IV secretory pathway VirB4 component
MTNESLHLYDSTLEGLARRGYQGGMPIELLSDAFVYESNGAYFHTVDGRFAKIWRVSGIDHSLASEDDFNAISQSFGDVLNKFPEGSSGQFIRHTHRDIRNRLNLFRSGLDAESGEFAMEIADSIVKRQSDAAVHPNGFFSKLSTSMIEKMEKDMLDEMDDVDVREQASIAIHRELREGRYPFLTDLYMVFYWTPEYMFGKLIDSTLKSALASVGLIDANKVAHEAYNKHVKAFQQHCYEIEQALAAYNFNPEILTARGFLDLTYQLFNPVRSFMAEAPQYRADLPIVEALSNKDSVHRTDRLSGNPMYSVIETENKGWTIHDNGHKYFIRPVSLLGKPNTSSAGMLQAAMSGIESECLVTINWSVVPKVAVMGRLWTRGRLLSAKETMHMGDAETRQRQKDDLEMVKGKISSENVNNREQFFDVSLHVNLMGFDQKMIEDQAAQLEKLMWRIGYVENTRGDAVVRSSMPMNFRPESMKMLRRDTPHLTGSLSHLCPLYLEYQGVPDPAILMNNRAGEPIFIDLWSDQVNTAHGLICGTTGSGKSFTFNNLLMALRVKYRPKVWIIDKGDSYESLCLVLDGNYVRLATEPFIEPVSGKTVQPICINPFWIQKDDNGRNVMPALEDKFFITRMLCMMMNSGDGSSKTDKTVRQVTVSLIYKALDDFYSDWLDRRPFDEPRFSDFIPYLQGTNFDDQRGQSVVDSLTLYYGNGPFAALFDGYLQVNWDNDFTVLETQRMAKSPALGAVTLALFRQIDLYCKFKLKRGRKKIVAVDEAWATLSDPTAAAALASFYRELRRYNAGCLLISQTVKDFVNLVKAESGNAGDAQDGILENTSHYFFLACSASDYHIAQQELAFTNEEVALWRSLASLPPIFSEVFYRIRTKQNIFYSGVFRLFSSPMTLWVASSHPDDFQMRETKTQEIVRELDIPEALARQKAISTLSKSHPFGARYHVE